MPTGWVVPENRALAYRQHLLYLPRGYAALLITASLLLAVTFRLPIPALWLFGFGWAIGKTVTFYDWFAWAFLARNLLLPRVMRA